MLDDRPYMREPAYGSQRSYTVILIGALIICFFIQNIFEHYNILPINDWFALNREALLRGHIWQFITFQFLHAPFGDGGFMHIFFNCLGIYVFGRAVEEALGPKRFLQVYLGSGVLGGLVQCLGTIIFPLHFGGRLYEMVGRTPDLVGASAGLFGLLATFGALFPNRQITLLLFFILPVTITGRMLLIFSGLLSVFGMLVPVGPVAHAAHFGGLLGGLAFVRWVVHGEWQMPRFRPRREKIFVRGPKANRRPGRIPPQEMDLPSEEFISREVDPILDKISAHGIQSLTERERKILEAARAKMAKQ